MSASVNRFFSAADDVVGDHVGRRVDGERVEAARRVGEVEQRAGAPAGTSADRRLGRVALGVEHDHRAALAAQVLGDGRDQEARLALLDGPGHRRVLVAQLGVDRDARRARRAACPRRRAAARSPAGAGASGSVAAGERHGRCSRPTAAARATRARSRANTAVRSDGSGLPSPRCTRRAVEPEQAVAHGGPALDEPVLGALARAARRRCARTRCGPVRRPGCRRRTAPGAGPRGRRAARRRRAASGREGAGAPGARARGAPHGAGTDASRIARTKPVSA